MKNSYLLRIKTKNISVLTKDRLAKSSAKPETTSKPKQTLQ